MKGIHWFQNSVQSSIGCRVMAKTQSAKSNQNLCVKMLIHTIYFHFSEPLSPNKLNVCTVYNLTSQTDLAYVNWHVSLFMQSSYIDTSFYALLFSFLKL